MNKTQFIKIEFCSFFLCYIYQLINKIYKLTAIIEILQCIFINIKKYIEEKS